MADVLPWVDSYWIRFGVVFGWIFLWTTAALLVLVWRRKARSIVCQQCGYPREGLSDSAACPECGKRSWGRSRPRSRRLSRCMLAVALFGAGASLPGLSIKARWDDLRSGLLLQDSLWGYYMSMPPLYNVSPRMVSKRYHFGPVEVRVMVDRRDSYVTDEEVIVLLDGEIKSRFDADHRVTDVVEHDLDGKGDPEIVIKTWTGGASCCTTLHVFRRAEHGRLIGVEPLGPGSPLGFEPHTDGGSRWRVADRHFAYWNACGACSYALIVWYRLKDDRFEVDWDYTLEQIELEVDEPSVKKAVADLRERATGERQETFPLDNSMYWGMFVELLHLGRRDEAWVFFDAAWPNGGEHKAAFEAQLLDHIATWEHYPHMLEANGGSIARGSKK